MAQAVFLYGDNPHAAKEYLQKAYSISTAINDRDGQAKYLHNLGSIASKANELEEAVSYYFSSLSIRREIQDYAGIARNLYDLALVWSELGDLQQAVELLKEAVELDVAYQYPDLQRDATALEKLQSQLVGKE